MRITCRKCKQVQEVDEKTVSCPTCRIVLRRCTDCTQYDVRTTLCKTVNRTIPAGEADYPTYSSASTYCRTYLPINPPPG